MARARHHFLLFFQSPTTHTSFLGCLFATQKSDIISHYHHQHQWVSSLPHWGPPESSFVARATKRIFRIQLRYHTNSSVFVFFTQVAKPRPRVGSIGRKFLSFAGYGGDVLVVCSRRQRGATDVSNECVLMMIDWVLRALGYVNSLA